jgi:hypothetical protein
VSTRRTWGLTRRSLLNAGASAGAYALIGLPKAALAQGKAWKAGQIAHIIPTANHERFLVKVSFNEVLDFTPRLTVDRRAVDGERTDLAGRFWRFDARGLSADTEYELQVVDESNAALCDPWPLRTFPGPEAKPERLRILSYTCSGGFDSPPLHGKTLYLDMEARRRLLARGMSYKPEVVLANGDQIYWDIKTFLNKPFADFIKREWWDRFGGELDVSRPMLDPVNAEIFTGVCDYQIVGVYGTTLRSTPASFLTDDHDNFENDEYTPGLATMPPNSYGPAGAIQTQAMYYPELLTNRHTPDWLPGGDVAKLVAGSNTAFGAMRYGTLVEALLYDCRRWATYEGDHAVLIPKWTENWLIARTAAEDTAHLFHVPSLPFAYSSGKLGDWYPDLLDQKTGHLTIAREKPGWQRGWFGQHQRLIAAIAAQKTRPPIVIQGDFHASAAGRVTRSGELGLDTPVHVVTTGTLGTGDLGYPSAARGIAPSTSQMIGIEETLSPVEKNGFSIIDVTRDKVTFRMFTWRPPQELAEIDTMEPTLVYEIPRA